jgi:hypothetical protein
MSKGEEDDMTSGAINGSLLEVNALTYSVPESLCLFTARSFNRNFAQRSAYSGTQQETIRFDLNSSSLYCCPQNSYLTFQCKLTTPAEPVAQATTASGSMMNIFRSIVIRSKSGVEICRNDALNVFSRYDTLYNESPAYLQKYGALEGWCDVRSPTSTQVIVQSGTWARFAIPLRRLSKLFDTPNYLPAALMSGLSLELVLESVNRAFLEVGGSSPSLISGYELQNVSIMLDNTTLTDASARVLNAESASNSLEILFDSIYTTVVDQPALSASVNCQVRRACSEATQAVAIVVPQSTQANIKFDSFASVPWDTLLHRWRLGGLYMTSSDIQDPQVDGVESFFLASAVSDVFKHPHMEGGISLTEFKAWAGVHAVSLEKNTSLLLSGSATSNSRVLELDATFQTSVTAKQVYVMMRYATVVRCYLDNVAVTS